MTLAARLAGITAAVIVCVRLSAITIGARIDPSEAPAAALAERLGFLEVTLCAPLIDLRHRRRRVAYHHVRYDLRAQR